MKIQFKPLRNNNVSLYLWIALVFCVSLSSCTKTYYQICEVKSTELNSDNGFYLYTDSVCSVFYDFWCKGGNPGFLVANNTDKFIYVDLENSFYIRNGIANDYFLDCTVTVTKTFGSINSSFSLSSSQSIYVSSSGSQSAYAHSSGSQSTYFHSLGSQSAYASTSGAIFGNQHFTYRERSKSVTTEAKSLIPIPPRSGKFFSKFNIQNFKFASCDFDITPKRHHSPKLEFSMDDSPIVFSNYITLRIGEDKLIHSFQNDFYIGSVTVYHRKDAFIKLPECPGEKRKMEFWRDSSPQKYYIEYSQKPILYKKPRKGPLGNMD